ncbi:AAA family ATPase [Piscinibacter defluvii]|uniref:AAA family ATPase n=1 Tax=Piscinibacter defluvii TaxID=1796922 RepID=UPI0013E3CB22|nr:AAA family ATPase [Piscinibacter defluvii]
MSAAHPLAPVACGVSEPTIWTAGNYLRQFKPIESVIDGLPVPRGGLVSITGPTGHGKTTISVALELAFVRGSRFAGREVTKGSVLVLAGENPDDWAMHLAATLQDQGVDRAGLFDHETKTALLVVPGVFSVAFGLDYLREKLSNCAGPLVAVVVDTSAAFYQGDDENSNTAMRAHASALRELSTLPGNPAVIVLCHPTKGATKDNLLPRGGGAFLAEVDANLTTWKDDAGVIELHWAGKIRGANFDPLRFDLHQVELAGLKDCRGRPIHSVAARHLADERAEQLEARELNDQDRVLIALRRDAGSLADLARACGWINESGEPLKARADRRLKKLHALGLVEQDRKGKWRLTTKGHKDAEALP